MHPTLKRYRYGLWALGLFTLIFLIVVLVQAGSLRQDNTTYRKADDIALKLNTYVTNNQKVPNSLSAMGVKDVPKTITYHRQSSISYQFCVTYKSASQGGTGITNLPTALGSGISGFTSGGYLSGGTAGYLYIPPTYHKGANCQTIVIYGPSDTLNLNGTGSGSPTDCKLDSSKPSNQAYQDYLSCLQRADEESGLQVQ